MTQEHFSTKQRKFQHLTIDKRIMKIKNSDLPLKEKNTQIKSNKTNGFSA